MIQKQKIIMKMIREKMIHMKKMTVKKIKQIIFGVQSFCHTVVWNLHCMIIKIII